MFDLKDVETYCFQVSCASHKIDQIFGNFYRSPFEQPTKDGIDESNIGNQMLQKMGWNKGSGLGKTHSGRTDIIQVDFVFNWKKIKNLIISTQVQQRSRGVGLGMRGASYGLDGSEGDYRTAAKKITQARYMEAEY